MGSWKKIILGEKMPDKDDPKYRTKYEKDVDAGRRFARWCRLDKCAARVQDFANRHTKAFLVIVFGIVILCFGMNVYRMGLVWSHGGKPRSAVKQQDELIQNRHQRVRKAIGSAHCLPPGVNNENREKQNQNDKDYGYADAKED